MEGSGRSAIDISALERETDELRARLGAAEEELRAIRAGEIDAFVVQADEESVYTLELPDHPFRLLVDHLTEAAATITSEATILCSNERFCSLAGRSATALAGGSLRDLLTPESRKTLDAMLAEAPQGDVEGELSLQLGDRTVPVPFCLHSIGTSAFGQCFMLTDLRESKRYEALERTQAALRKSEEELKRADRRKDEFLATLAHELRNPLAPMRNAVEFLRAKGTSAPELRWAHDVIDRQVQLMARLLEDLLDVSRVALDRPHLRMTLVELGAVIDAAVETSFPLMERARHDLEVTLPPEPIYLQADPVRLSQVFANLLNNAAKYTDDGGRIRIVAEMRRRDVVVSISDTGIGIAPDQLPHVFDIFSQAKPASGRAQGGLGIGLSLVKGLVELHGGAVDAHSEGPGKGSTFRVRLPVVDGVDDRRARQMSDGATVLPRASRHVLVVDDHRDSADSLAMLLKAMGHEVDRAYDGEQAIELASKILPELILLDIGMPRMDGYETCRRMKAESWGAESVIVALTGWGQDEDRRKSRAAGFDHHLVKPVEIGDLVALMSTLDSRRDGEGARAPEPSRRDRFPGDGHARSERRASGSTPSR
jgi:signal transduction histidine kinase/ActR/RegA family two-component response regulator